MSDKKFYSVQFTNDDVPAGAAQVRAVTTQEGLSRPYRIDADLELPPIGLEPQAWILLPAEILVVREPDGAVARRWNGIVTATRERASRASTKQRVGITVESPMAALRYTRDHRIFQGKTTQQIAQEILDENGIPSSGVSFRLNGSYKEREVCTQLGETTLDFLARILEEDGIFYFHEHGDDGPVIVFADAAGGFADTASLQTVPFAGRSGLVSDCAILDIAVTARLRPAKVTLRDHDFKRPSLDLTASASGDAPLGREHYEYPGRYTDPGEGSRRAQAYLDALTAEATPVRATSDGFALTPGHTFELTGAPDPALDKKWVVRDVEQVWEDKGGGQRFENRLLLLPADAKYRPLRRAPKPSFPGPQIAHVTGPSGQEIHCDEHGRVKVHFPWDRHGTWDDKSSAWVRVGQLHTSGSVAIPRIGWEVLVDFEDGDPDKPVILGRLYNNRYGPPENLPKSKTVSSLQSKSSPQSGGFNEIKIDDGGGSELMSMQAQKDMNVHVANNKTEKVTVNATLGVGSNLKRTVGASETVKVSGASGLTVGSSQTWSVGASRTVTVSGDEKVDVAGSRSMTIGGSHTTMTPMMYSATTPAAFTETVGGSAIEAAALGVSTAVAGSASVTVGAAKIDAVATGLTDFTIGAKASTVGGALIAASGKDVGFSVGGAKATTVGGAWAASTGGDFEFSSGGTLAITVGGAVAMNATKVVLKVGGSSVTMSAGAVVIKSDTIKLTATGPQPELAALVDDK
jgi:type VI secretion system secreted protein VgrG